MAIRHRITIQMIVTISKRILAVGAGRLSSLLLLLLSFVKRCSFLSCYVSNDVRLSRSTILIDYHLRLDRANSSLMNNYILPNAHPVRSASTILQPDLSRALRVDAQLLAIIRIEDKRSTYDGEKRAMVTEDGCKMFRCGFRQLLLG